MAKFSPASDRNITSFRLRFKPGRGEQRRLGRETRPTDPKATRHPLHYAATSTILTRREHCLKEPIQRGVTLLAIFGAAEGFPARSFGNPEGHAALLTRSTVASIIARIASSSANRSR